jgi:hypothetical protein
MSPVVQLLKNFPIFVEKEGLLLCSQKPHHWSLYRGRLIHSNTPHTIPLRTILKLSTHVVVSSFLVFLPISDMNFSRSFCKCPTRLIHLTLITIIMSVNIVLFLSSQWLHSHLDPGRFIKFLVVYTIIRFTWTGIQSVAKRLPTQRTTQTFN